MTYLVLYVRALLIAAIWLFAVTFYLLAEINYLRSKVHCLESHLGRLGYRIADKHKHPRIEMIGQLLRATYRELKKSGVRP